MNTKDNLSHLLATRRWCYTIPACQDAEAQGGYIPSIAIEDVVGHYPLAGRDGGSPWFWGKTLEDAERTCDEANAKLGYDLETAFKIVTSTFRMPSHKDQPEEMDED